MMLSTDFITDSRMAVAWVTVSRIDGLQKAERGKE